MAGKRVMIFMLVGAKGTGKSTVRDILMRYGFTTVSNESGYIKYGSMYPDRDINQDESIQDRIYEEAEQQIMDAAKHGNVVYEATGTNRRWQRLKRRLSQNHTAIVLKVTCPMNLALKRLNKRGWDSNYPAKLDHIQDIDQKSRNIVYDFIIDNSSTLAKTEKKIAAIIEKLKEVQ